MRYYALEHNKKEYKIKIILLKENKAPGNFFISRLKETKEGDIERWNDCYYLCTNRNKLKEFAKELLNEWIEYAELELNKIKAIKI